MQEKVSVVITTKNEEKNIENCLKSIELQTWTNIEIIVVDNNSSDKTKEISRKYTELVFDKGPERSAQRNYGLIDKATGKFAMFVDADMMMTPTLIETCIREIVNLNAIALHIEEIVLGTGLLGSIRRFERSFYSGTVIDGARFFRREDFKSIGGFDESLPPGPEDWDLDKRFKLRGDIRLISHFGPPIPWELGTEVGQRGVQFDNRFIGIYHNEADQTLNRYLQKKSYYSGSMTSYIERWPNDLDVAKQLGVRYRFLVVFLEQQRWRKVLRKPILSMFMLGLRILVGVNYLRVQRRSSKVLQNIYER